MVILMRRSWENNTVVEISSVSFRIVVIGGDFDKSIKFPSVLLILPAITLSSCDPTSSLTPHLSHAHTNTQIMVRLKYFACTENKIKKCRYKCKVERVSANHTHTQICTKQYTCRHARVRHCLCCRLAHLSSSYSKTFKVISPWKIMRKLWFSCGRQSKICGTLLCPT